ILLIVKMHKKLLMKEIIIVSGVLIGLGVLCYTFVTPIKIRVDEIIKTKFELPTEGKNIETYNSINVRNGIYYCSYNVLKNNILTGVGIGDVQNELNSCYNSEIGAKIYTWTDYNSH